MVKICSKDYPKTGDETYADYFEKYSFPLSSFQKHAIEAIIEGHDVLVCAPTGSGKTLPADFAIDYFVKKGKRVIYTSPIKALSNNKYYEFSQKYPDISFGVLTGDIKFNPDANVLLMTTEILQNTLYRKKQNQHPGEENKSLLLFEMDFEEELGCIIHDEIHFINDAERGKVWEECLMMTPPKIQMVLLSATLDGPEKFAHWIENRHGTNFNLGKQVYLASSDIRPVPLTHYSFITTNQGLFKAIKDKDLEKKIKEVINKPILLQSASGEFNEPNYHLIKKYLQLMEQKQIFVKRTHIINQLCKYLVENNMLPAVCFILSRKQIEIAAKEVTVPLLEDDSKVGYTIKRECEQILRAKISNFQEYLELPEYISLVSLLEKGIGIHHSGLIPIFREIVEILFMKGYIKLLFATETIAVGINTPTKTVIFTDVKKFDGSTNRMLLPHEFVQASGRAGRRGLDTVGHVIHLNNLFRNVELTEYKTMMQGKPQKLVSKFKVSYNLLLNLIHIDDQDYAQFCKKSMAQEDIIQHLGGIYQQYTEVKQEVQQLESLLEDVNTPQEVLQKFIDLEMQQKSAVNKKRKEIDKELQQILLDYKFVQRDKLSLIKLNDKKTELHKIREHYDRTDQYLLNQIHLVLKKLEQDGFIEKYGEQNKMVLLNPGKTAAHIREVQCLTFAKLLESNEFDDVTSTQIATILSCFTNISVADDLISITPSTRDQKITSILKKIKLLFDEYQTFELEHYLETGVDYSMHYDLLQYIKQWFEAESASECKEILQNLEQEKGIFLGEFVKAILKINNISSELEKVAEEMGNIELLSKLKEIPIKTLKFVATNQSLYI
uniref:Helicase n=1 Tax=viral metagenome TaxID=1070528 RepID=A0A6C0B9B2_9ZZZZ